MGEPNAVAVVEKSLRSVFVGNIPYEATEEKLRDIFSQVGPVLSFKLMYDRESGKPKGYGFCEYKDQETALSAMRNLNGFEIGGRPLRVDNACTEKSRMEMQSLMMGPIVESPFGPEVEPEKAPEAISNAVASLPPEQMYELMRQMKLCVRNNPAEARTMLMNNPQLAYALLQAQVVMRIIDPKTAVQILHGSKDSAEPVVTSPGGPVPVIPPIPPPNTTGPSIINGGPPIPPIPSNMPTHFPPPQNPVPPTGPLVGGMPMVPRMSGPPPSLISGPPIGVPAPTGSPFPPSQPVHPVLSPNRGAPFPAGDYDLRQMMSGAPRGPAQPVLPPGPDQDMRMPPIPPDNFGPPPGHDFEGRFQRDFDQRDARHRDGPNPTSRDRDSRDLFARDPRDNRDRDSRPARDPRDPRGMERERDRERDRDRDRDYRNNPPAMDRDPRGRNFQVPDKDFRSRDPVPGPNPLPINAGPRAPPNPVPAPSIPPALAGQDQEKASLIMQVLQLSDEQIRMLPPEQQASILQLKDQIQRSSH